MNPLTARLIPWLLAVLALVGIGWAGGWHFGAGRWQSKYTALEAQGLAQKLQTEQVARQAIQGQLEAAHAALTRNTQVTNDLEQKNAATAAELDRNRAALGRLRATSAGPAARCDRLPEADRGPEAASTGPPTELRECQNVLIEGLAEGQLNADQLDALSTQISPQL